MNYNYYYDEVNSSIMNYAINNIQMQPQQVEQYGQSKLIYINQNFIKPAKVLVNPNFKGCVHINPNFNPKLLKTSVHINPNHPSNLKQRHANLTIDVVKAPIVINKPIISTKNKLVRIQTKQIVPIINKVTKYKIIRNTIENVISPVRRRKLSLHSTYKIIRKNIATPIKSPKINKFKLDRRNSLLKSKSKANLINIDLNHQIIKNVTKIMKIRGHLFRMDADRKIMRLINRNPNKFEKIKLQKIIIGGYVYEQKNESNVFVNVRKAIVRKLKKAGSVYKIDRTEENAKKKLKKNNIPCQFFKKTGRCLKFKKGLCNKVHNNEQINLCTRFLQGACIKTNCLLSHKISPEKMPTCKYYLEGLCHREDCQYLHVKISPKSDICKEFLQGYCSKAAECDKRHQYLCPDFEKNGACPKKMCTYPHGNVVRQYTHKILNNIARKNQLIHKKQRICKIKPKIEQATEIVNKARYYEGESIDSQNDSTESLETPNESLAECSDKVESNLPASLLNRPKLGSLPMFIPFD